MGKGKLTADQRDMIGGGLHLIFIGLIFAALLEFVFIKNEDLLYPYITPQLIKTISIFITLGYFIPGVLLIVLFPLGHYLDLTIAESSKSLSKTGQILLVITSILACVGIFGIRNGVSIILHIKEANKYHRAYKEGNKITPEQELNQGPLAYRLYLLGGTLNLIAYGLLFVALSIFMQVIEIDLSYPYITQKILIGMLIWSIGTFIVPSVLYLISFIIIQIELKNKGKETGEPPKLNKIQNILIILGSILAIMSIFGLSIGINLIKSRWMQKIGIEETAEQIKTQI
ncbi:MAG: hypothetical protein ACTSU2_17045 [Promethearchaeota archaeon]